MNLATFVVERRHAGPGGNLHGLQVLLEYLKEHAGKSNKGTVGPIKVLEAWATKLELEGHTRQNEDAWKKLQANHAKTFFFKVHAILIFNLSGFSIVHSSTFLFA
jgi:hypothetical protein